MYKIIGADGKEYGPITADQLRQWMAEGRANAQTKILAEGASEWKPLSEFPEFAAAAPGPAVAAPGLPPPMPGLAPAQPALQQVSGPATGLIVVAVLNFLAGIAALLFHLLGASLMAGSQMSNQPWANMFSGTVGIVSNIIVILLGVLVLFGGLKMKKLENYGLAMAASIAAMLPCSVCCVVGLPIGIWAVVVLSRPDVKSAFH